MRKATVEAFAGILVLAGTFAYAGSNDARRGNLLMAGRVAVGDINGDGLPDAILPKANGQSKAGTAQEKQSYRWPKRHNSSSRWTKAGCYGCITAHNGHWWECIPSYCPPPVNP